MTELEKEKELQEQDSQNPSEAADGESEMDLERQADFDAEKKPVSEPQNRYLEDSEEEGHAYWYVVHTYSGHEKKVKANIEKIVENRNMQDLVRKIVVPIEKVEEIKNGKKKQKERKIFPGYVIVKMVMTDESWYLVRNTQGVTGFVGHGSKPIPLSEEEVRKMGIDEQLRVQIDVEEGDMVQVINGSFENFVGTVEKVNAERQVLRVKTFLMGRETSVELQFSMVKKLY